MKKIKNIFALIVFITSFSFSNANETIDTKIALLYETTVGKDPSRAIEEIKNFCNELKVYDKLTTKKRVGKIFKTVKKKYLHTYHINSFFPSLFSVKTYNCVTGTALFAIIFDELEIPYNIIEVPQHVYLIAYPNSLKIAIESTDKKNGVYAWSEYSQQKAIQYLLDINKITKFELELKGTDAILQKYFYSDSELDFKNLVGIHFFNRALYYFERDSYENAWIYITKANKYHEKEINHIVEGSLLRNLISETESSDIKFITYLLRFYEVSNNKNQVDIAVQTFRWATYDALVERKDLEYIDSTEKLINTILTDSNYRNVFNGNLYFAKAAYYSMRHEIGKAKSSVLQGYSLIPETKIFYDAIAEIFVQDLYESEIYKAEYEIDTMETQLKTYPFLNTIPLYYNYYVTNYIEYIGDLFLSNKSELGFEKLKWLEEYIASSDIELFQSYYNDLANLYGEIANFYYRSEQFPLALEWVSKGLKIEPESEYLLRKKSYILDNM